MLFILSAAELHIQRHLKAEPLLLLNCSSRKKYQIPVLLLFAIVSVNTASLYVYAYKGSCWVALRLVASGHDDRAFDLFVHD